MTLATENGPSLGRVLHEDFNDTGRYVNFAAFAAAYAAGTTPWDKDAYSLHESATFVTIKGSRGLSQGAAGFGGFVVAAFLAEPLTKAWLRLVFASEYKNALLGSNASIFPYGPPVAPHETYPTVTGLDGQQVMQISGEGGGLWRTNKPSYTPPDAETPISAEEAETLAAALLDTRALIEGTVVDGLITTVRVRTYLGDVLYHDITEDVSALEWTSLLQAVECSISGFVPDYLSQSEENESDKSILIRAEVYDAEVNPDPYGGGSVTEAPSTASRVGLGIGLGL